MKLQRRQRKKKKKNSSKSLQRKESRYKNTAFYGGKIRYIRINFPNKLKQAQSYGSSVGAKNVIM